MQYKDFKSPTGEPIRVVSFDLNHITIVPADTWKGIPDVLWQPAYAAGCISRDMTFSQTADNMEKEVVQVVAARANKKTRIKTVITEMILNNELECFDKKTNKPICRIISERLDGERVFTNERDEALYEVQQELKEK